MSIGAQFLRTLGRPASYTAPGGSAVPCRAIVKDVDRQIRVTRSTDMINADAVATVDEALKPRRGGILTIAANEYEITGKVRSGAPGLVDLSLSRISGAGVEAHDHSASILLLMGEDVVINGRTIRAHVNRSGIVLEDDGLGNGVEIIRQIVAVRVADAAGISSGSIVHLDGKDHRVLRVMRDGVSMIRIVC